MDLSELFGYCRGLDADKVTDRKKNVEKLRLMLNKSYVLQCLDKNTDMKISGASTSRNLTWDDVFKAVCSYVALESSALQKGRESQSATSLSNKEKKKQEIGSLMKLVIKMTDKRGPRMKCVNVIRHISDVLQDPFSCEAYGLDYSNILLKNILTVRKYCNEIPTATWHELISMYCKLYVDALCGIDRMVLIRVICALIKQSSQHCDMRPKRLLAFFAEVFKNIKQEKAGCIELLVAALNVFTKSIAINSRLQICKLGEAIFTNLLYLWASRPSDALKIEIVEFFRIQIHSHHPLGRRKDVSGSFAVDWDVWTGHLRRLYGVVKGDLEQIGGRNRFSTAGKDAALTHEYIDLAADVCNQLFSEKFSVIEVTQVGADIQWSSTKRRPIELGWSFLRDKITCLGQTLQTLPWLQLLKRLIEKYPQNIPEDEFLPFLNLISQLLSESKRNEIADHILSCALSIIKGWKQFKSLQIASTKMCESVLQKMWTSTLRMVSLHHAEAMAYRLLTAMLEASLIKPECEIWSLFLPSNTTPTQGAIDFLSTYLVKYDLPEHYRTTMLGAVDSENSPYNLRIQLIDWLLPCHEDVGDNKGKVKDKQINLDTMSCVIALLVLKSSVKDFQEYSHETDELGTELERVYLQISIDLPLPVERLTEDNPPARVLDNTHLPVLLKKIEESFQIYMQSFSSITEPELSSLEDMSVCCCVLGKFIHWLLHFGILSDHTVTKSDLVDIWKSALKKFTSLLMDFIAKEGTSQLKLVVPLLLTMFGWESGDDTTGYIAATICRWATPNKLIDQLGKIITEVSTTFNVSRMNVDGPRHQRNSDLLARKRRRVLEDFDDMDIEFDNAVAQDQGEDLCFEEEEMRELQDSQEDSLREGEVNKSILSREILTEAQQLRLDAVQVLCKWGSHTRVPPSVNLPIHAEVLLQLFHKKLEEVFDEKTFDASQPLYIQMMSVILSHLARSYNTLSDTHLKIAVNVLRKVIKFHRQDQDVCCMCLGMLTQIIPHLHHIDNSLSLVREECRDVILHLVSAFWTLQEDGNYIPSIRLAIAMCMETLLKYDPASNWTILTLKAKNNEEDTETSVAEEFPFCLSDPCHSVRSFAASSIANLFVCQRKGGTVPLERSRQIEMFDKIYTTLQDSLDIKTKLSPERAQDEMNNRTASILSALGTVIIVSPVCEKRALFALCQLIKENGVEINPVKKVLQRVAKVLKYNSIESFLASHLPYLVNQWLNLKYAISEFPQQLLLHDSKVTFYQKYYQILIPELMMHKKVSDAQEVVKEMKQEWLDVLKLCIPKIIVHILPLFAATKSEETGMEENVKRRTAHASICYDLLLKELTKEVVDKTIVSNLDELVVNILMCLHDNAAEELSVTGHIRNMNPEPNPPHYNTYVTTSTLDYLTGSFSGNAKSLVDVLSESQDAIQKILVSLASRLSCVHRMQDKYSVLCMYRLFVNLLLNEFDNKLGGSLAYTLREILYRPVFLIHNMNILHRKTYLDMEYRQTIVCVTLDLLRHVCTVTIKTCPQMLSKYLSWLCCNLVPLVEVGEEIGEQSLSLLKFLVVDNSTCFEASISNLDPFPENAAFQQLAIVHKRLKDKNGAFTLREEIEKFLLRCEMRTSSGNSHVEGLKFLWQQLSTCQKELTELVKECEENQSGSILCRFICELVSMLTDASEDLRLVVSQCLGEIGPVDLSTVCLPKDKRLPGLKIALDCFKDSSEQQEYCWLFHLLNSYIIDSSMEVVQSAVQVLKSMLSTQTGISFASAYKDCLADDDHLFSYLHPFLAKKKTSLGSVKSRTQEFLDIVDSEDVWIPCHGNHVQWLRNLSLALIRSGAVRNELLRLVGPVCTHKSDFCEVVLPFLIHDILLQGSDLHTDVLSRQIAKFFTLHLSRRGDQDSTRSRTPMSSYDQVSICDNKDSIRTLLNTIQYLRQQTLPRRGHSPMTPYDNNFWLDIDYLQASRAAQYCSAQFTALLYAEIWCATNKDHTESKNFSQSLSQDTRMEALSIASSDSGLSVQNVLLDAYRQIGDPDGVYGCGAGRLADSISRIQTYQHENLWEKAVITQDIETCNQGYTSQIGILKALQNMGAAHLLDMYLQGVSNSGPQTVAPEIEEFHYEAAWKMGKWNLTRPARLSESCGFQQALYASLCSLKDGHDTLAASAVKSARLCCVQSVGTMSVESSRCLYPLLASLHCLNQVQEAIDATRSREKSVVPLLKKWKSSCVRLDNDFEFVEPVYNTKSTLCKLLGSWIKDEQLHSAFVENLLKFAEVARQANRNQFAERIIHELRSTEISKMDLYVSTLIEEASLYWARAEHNTAKHLMKVLLDKLHLMKQEKNEAAKFYPMALGIYGNWLAETRSESPNVIMENYLEKTVQLLESASQEGETALDAYLSLARYADSQYQSIINFMKSTTYEAKQNLMKKAQADAEKLQELGDCSRDRYYRTLVKQFEIDEKEVARMKEDKMKFLVKAVQNYIKCLKCGDKHDLRIFRLISLWFTNASFGQLNLIIQEGLPNIKSYKFLPLMYQLAARLNVKQQRDTSSSFQPTLTKIIERAAVEHPHHTLNCILALANANKDAELTQQGKSIKRSGKLSRTQSDPDSGDQGRVQAAKNLVEKLKSSKDYRKVAVTVLNMERLSSAYIQLANFPVDQYKRETKPIALSSSLWINQLKNLSSVALPTTEMKVDPMGDYKSILYITGFQSTFQLAGGINLPKIITCLGSDGVARRQLVKGRDDLRQDAVMQQVFGMVNSLLRKNTETRKRKMHVRTYKVIPLSQRSGLLEWCEGTQPIGEYLIGRNGAHSRYQPKDWAAIDCRNYMQEVQKSNLASKVQHFLKACKNFQPVMRHFFMEKFSDPASWYEHRVAYTRSVATTSIVGYILGLGDRHVQNILIDSNTAELVHIDLGVAFEQGRILPTPETVPFRLTRDIVDGMGVLGVEGVFRRCCEKTMEVMHDNQEALLTILEVLLYDPLYAWTISPARAFALQQRRDKNVEPEASELNSTTGDIMDMQSDGLTDAQENVNKTAERALLRLQQKLQGIEDSIQLSVSGQVNLLIQEARDPKNLARLFPGWQPYI